MFCSNCGKPVADDASFCASCGTALKAEATPVAEPVVEAPVAVEAPVQQEAPVEVPVEAPVAVPVATPVAEPTYQQAPTFSAAPVTPVNAGSLLIKGILALALSEIGIPGIILGSMAKNLAAQFMAQNGGKIFGKAKIGSILGRVGFGLGIGFTIFWALYFLIFVLILGSL